MLFLATYFPKPGNPLMGTWALSQAQALRRQGIDLRVVSLTSWVPRLAGRFSAGARAYACCPRVHSWDGLRVDYPHWFLYQVGPLKRLAYRDPEPQLRLGWLSAKANLRRIMREFKPDVICAHHTLANGFIAARLHDLYGVPFITIDWDFGEITDCAVLPKRRQAFERIANKAAAAVGVAHRMEDGLRQLFPHAHVCTVHNGVAPLPVSLWKEKRPVEIQNKLVVFSAGIFYERKGFPLLVRAFAQIADKYPQAVLRIAGDGAQCSLVQQAVAETGLGNRVQLLGFQPHSRILQEMVWSDIFALIGWDEPFATVFMEAMAAGKPLVCANDGGVNDVFQDGIHGYALPPHNISAAAQALDRLLNNAGERERMGQAARRLFDDRLTSDATAKSLIKIFEAACPQRQKAGI